MSIHAGAQGDLTIFGNDPIGIVLITAGASAPEIVVQDCIDWLQREFNANARR